MKKIFLTSYILILTSYISFAQAWVPVGKGVNSYVTVLDSSNGLLYAGGTFDSAGGLSANRVASWNGGSWSALGSGLNNTVYAITKYKGSLIVAGYFTTAGGVPAYHIASWNGTLWSALGGGVSEYVSALTVYNDNLIVAGNFDSAGGSTVNNIAMWNGTTWSSVGTGLNYYIQTLAVYNGNLYAGGGAGYYPALSKWNGTAWDSIPGLYDYVNWPCVNNSITSLVVNNGLLYAGGLFSNSNGSKDYAIGAWNGTAWVEFLQGYSVALSAYSNSLFQGGPNIYELSDTVWNTVGNGIFPCDSVPCLCGGGSTIPSIVYAIAGYNGKLYAGGSFKTSYFTGVPSGNAINYLGEYTGPLGINQLKAESVELKVFPNPSNGIFNLQIESSVGSHQSSVVEVYNILGEKVAPPTPPKGGTSGAVSTALPLGGTRWAVNLSGQPSGIYLYRIITETGNCIASGKLVKK